MPAVRPFVDRLLPGADGATINVADWPGTQGPLVCVHGLTSSSRAFAGLASELPDVRLLAVDCRGRGESSKEGPFGMRQHAEDLAAALDAAGIERATFVGHSMGAYVVEAFAAAYPERVEQLVFVDGGYFLDYPAELTPDMLLEMMLGTFLEKLRRTWTSFEEYCDYYRATPMYAGGIDEYGLEHFRYDLTGQPPELRSKIVEECVAPDWRDVLDYPAVTERLAGIEVPVLLLRAPGGLMGTGDAVIPDEVRDAIVKAVPQTQVVDVPGTNHHTILTSVSGARAVAAAVTAFTSDRASERVN
ncbi:MAG: alpha/beta hydrolase [Frankiaceae bacterium]|nr:alpha/beta hydrolase [Frankiaceae bacterium]